MMIRVITERSDREPLRDWLLPPPYVMNEELLRRNVERRLFSDWPGPVCEAGRLTPSEETLLFKQLSFCGHKLRKIYGLAHRSKNPLRIRVLAREYDVWLQRYSPIRARLTEGNLGLVYDLVGRSRFAQLDRDDMASEGMMALLRAVDTFDVWRGFRFSTYACHAILRSFSRAALVHTQRCKIIIASWDPEFEKGNAAEARHNDQRSLFLERLQGVLYQDSAQLIEIEKTVLAKRFPSEPGQCRQSLDEIGREMGVSKERIRQIQLSAIAKLRKTLVADEAPVGKRNPQSAGFSSSAAYNINGEGRQRNPASAPIAIFG